MVMAAELTAFAIRWAKGFVPPADLTPGMWVKIAENGMTKEDVAELGVMQQGEIVPFIQQAQWLTSEIGKITRTPAPEFMGGDTASGEALKQREIGLIGKVQRFQTKAGNAYEDWLGLAHRIQRAYGNEQPPAYTRFYCRWKDAELRNDQVVVQNVMAVADRIGERETLRQLAPVFGWDEQKIETLLAEKQADTQSKLTTLAGSLPMFGNQSTFGLTAQPGQLAAGNGGGAAVTA
jgi:hypothetical protein